MRAEGLEKPRRKRGRPPKVQSEVKTELVEEPMETKSEEKQVSDDETEEGRRKRKIKAPTRFQDIVQGKELDKILKEEGVIDDDNIGDAENENVSKEQVIGRMESKEGENLGELIVINNRQRQRARPGILRRRRKYQCNICKKNSYILDVLIYIKRVIKLCSSANTKAVIIVTMIRPMWSCIK